MLQLVPHLLLRTNSEKSEAAVALRNGNYLVSRIADDELATNLATCSHVDGVVIDLPLFSAIRFANEMLATGAAVPMLIITRAPEIVLRACSNVAAAHPHDGLELVTAVDLMLARHPLFARAKAS